MSFKIYPTAECPKEILRNFVMFDREYLFLEAPRIGQEAFIDFIIIKYFAHAMIGDWRDEYVSSENDEERNECLWRALLIFNKSFGHLQFNPHLHRYFASKGDALGIGLVHQRQSYDEADKLVNQLIQSGTAQNFYWAMQGVFHECSPSRENFDGQAVLKATEEFVSKHYPEWRTFFKVYIDLDPYHKMLPKRFYSVNGYSAKPLEEVQEQLATK